MTVMIIDNNKKHTLVASNMRTSWMALSVNDEDEVSCCMSHCMSSDMGGHPVLNLHQKAIAPSGKTTEYKYCPC